jgi:hypothetical protein
MRVFASSGSILVAPSGRWFRLLSLTVLLVGLTLGCGRVPSNGQAASSTRSASPISTSLASPSSVACQSTSRPATRFSMAFVYMPNRQEAVLFGGQTAGTSYFGDTWTWKAGCWTAMSPSTTAPPRTDPAAAFDAATGKVLIYGGAGPDGLESDTWAWDGQNWQQVATSGPQVGAVAASDPTSGHVLLFGVARNSGAAQTWSWDGTSWRELSPAHSPPSLMSPNLALDPVNNRLLLFGGQVFNQGAKNDTWTWTGTDWLQLSPATRPTPRSRAAMSGWSQGRATILLGGVAPEILTASDAWKWDGTNWSALSSIGGVRADAAAIDIGSRLLFFGGDGPNGSYNDFESWDGTTWTESP